MSILKYLYNSKESSTDGLFFSNVADIKGLLQTKKDSRGVFFWV